MSILIYLLWIVLLFFVTGFLLNLKDHLIGSRISLILGLVVYIGFLFIRARALGLFLINSLVAAAFFIPLPTALILWWLFKKKSSKRNLSANYLFLIATTAFALVYPKGIIFPTANKTGLWPFAFFWFEGFAYSLIAVSGISAMFSEKNALGKEILRRVSAAGFACFSIAQVLGAIWSFLGWGHPFMWSPRHLASAAVWLCYAGLVHIQYSGSSEKVERRLATVISALALFLFYSHLILEISMPRLGI